MDEMSKLIVNRGKKATKQRDKVTQDLRNMPWHLVNNNYKFNSSKGEVSILELFEGKTQLITYHFMMGPDWKEGCPICSIWADHFDSFRIHLSQRDATFKVVSRAPLTFTVDNKNVA